MQATSQNHMCSREPSGSSRPGTQLGPPLPSTAAGTSTVSGYEGSHTLAESSLAGSTPNIVEGNSKGLVQKNRSPLPTPNSESTDALFATTSIPPLSVEPAASSLKSPVQGTPTPALWRESSTVFEPPMIVLVVDDDRLTRTIMSRTLSRLGCHVSTAENGEIALEMIIGRTFRQRQGDDASAPCCYDVVFLDNQMPIMSGLEVVAKLREMGRRDFVVGVTGNALIGDQKEYFEAGVDQTPQHSQRTDHRRTMADTVDEALATVCNDRKPCPPSPSPSPDANDCTEQTLSRKREREVSLEPATPRTATSTHALDVKSPAKKGRVHLDTTLEEDILDAQSQSRSRTPSHPHSPVLSVSPLHDVKVRQISQGVEDIKWQQSLDSQQEAAPGAQPDIAPSQDADETQRNTEATRVVCAFQSMPALSSSFAPVEDATEEAEEARDIASSLPHTRSASESDGGEPDKGLKRKLADRATSAGPDSGPSTISSTTETAKRPRDDADKDDNPRVSKRPSPPPEQNEGSPPAPAPAPETPAPKLGGFMSYASAASPFASVKGQNVFSSAPSNNQKLATSSSTKLISLPLDTTSIHAPFTSPFSQSSFAAFAPFQTSSQQTTTPSTATKRTGFEAFAGTASPFASASPFSPARSKSPLGNNNGKSSILGRSKSPTRRTMGMNASAFTTYAGVGAHTFLAPHPKRARAESPNGGSSGSSLERMERSAFSVLGNREGSRSGEEEDREESERAPSTFGERLRASKDGDEEQSEEEKEKLTEQEVITGEEEEETLLHIRGKLYALCSQNQWKERGVGQLRLNVRRADGSGARLVMRKEAVYTLLLNVPLFQGMKCFLAQDPRYLRFSVIEHNKTVHYNLRVSNAKIAQELLDEINANIPF
ncbi:hypothetical protein J3R82DRAFT_2575 [Butyriboletus roseoflavus]|nr:hypothetical protein J3R82DRAFT_2575 [Butyriboletus roseoflavus]